MAHRLGVVLFWVCVVLGVLHGASVVALFAVGHPLASDYAWQWLPIDIALIVAGVSARYILGWRADEKGR